MPMNNQHIGLGRGITNQVVIHFLNEKTLKGTLYDFHPGKNFFHLITREEDLDARRDIEIPIEVLKAIFFVKTFHGDRHYEEKKHLDSLEETRVMAEFRDGELMVGEAVGVNKTMKGFYLFPVDPQSNNDCVFVVYNALRKLRLGDDAIQ